MRTSHWLCAALLGIGTYDADATQLLVAEYGMTPERVAVFMEDHATDAVELGFPMEGPTRVVKTDMTFLYEYLNKPYWTYMEVAFECKNRLISPASKDSDISESAKFRMFSGKTRAKNKVEHEPLTLTAWNTTTHSAIVQSRNVACNMSQVRRAIISSLKEDKRIDFNRLVRALEILRIDLVHPLSEDATHFDFLADEVWKIVWHDVAKPDIYRGRPLTAEESKQMDELMAQTKSRITNAQASVGNTMVHAKAERDFGQTATLWRKSRNLSKIERTILMAWQAQTPQALVSKLGPAQRVWHGSRKDEHFIYTNAFNGQNFIKTTQMVAPNVLADGVILAGIDKTCSVRFVAIPDAQGTMRVADVLVTVDQSGSGVAPTDKVLCGGVLHGK